MNQLKEVLNFHCFFLIIFFVFIQLFIKDKIVVGTLQGILRIFLPRKNEYSINDLMLEEELEGPILQIEAGRFLSGSKKLALAVLHPRKLVVYTVLLMDPNGGQTVQASEGCFYALSKNYEHKLPRNGHSFVYGAFGGVRDRDFICVQSLDGCFTFFEQEVRGFDRVLHDFLLPGPFAYLPSRDSFLIAVATMELVCVRYQSFAKSLGSIPSFIHNTTPTDASSLLGQMAIGSGSLTVPESGSIGESIIQTAAHQALPDSSGKKTAPVGFNPSLLTKQMKEEWRRNLGEHPLQINVSRCTRMLEASQTDIIVMCEHTLFILKENGEIRRQKRLERDPATFTTYKVKPDDRTDKHNILLATFDGVLLVLDDQQIKWASTVDRIPVVVGTGKFGEIRGFIVLLFDTGDIRVCYLGTDPIHTKISALEARDIDFAEIEREQKRLRIQIRDAQNIAGPPKGTINDILNIRAQVPYVPDNPHEGLGIRRMNIPVPSGLSGVDLSFAKDYVPGVSSVNEEGSSSNSSEPPATKNSSYGTTAVATSFTIRIVLGCQYPPPPDSDSVDPKKLVKQGEKYTLNNVQVNVVLPYPFIILSRNKYLQSDLDSGDDSVSYSVRVKIPKLEIEDQMNPVLLNFIALVPQNVNFTSLSSFANIEYKDPVNEFFYFYFFFK
jgi:Bardet-Biedl syndrome 9 protein